MSYPLLPDQPPATPQRPLPGAFLQTPAVPRNAPAAGAAPGAGTQPPLPRMPPLASRAQNQNSVDEARGARTITDTLHQESRYPNLDTTLSQRMSFEYDVPGSSPWAPFQKIKMYNIPDQIFDQYNRAQVSTSMGLFAELNHAWVAIDNALYLWDFTHPNPQLVGFEDQPNSINAVKLAKPRAGVFLPAITHLLVVSTTAEVILLGMGVETTPGGNTQVSLYQTGMAVSVRGLDIHSFASSDSTGRIFFGGTSDNDVYELKYSQEERWFQGRCAKVNHTSGRLAAFTPSLGLPSSLTSSLSLTNLTQRTLEHVEQMVVDDTRKLLYTLSSTSAVRVFHLKADDSLDLAITKEAQEIYKDIGHVISSHETLNAKVKIVSISPIPAAEAPQYHLVATTATGYRIFLSGTKSYMATANGDQAPTSIQALHVKTPPLEAPGEVALNRSDPKQPIQSLVPTRMAARFPPGYFFWFALKDPAQREDTLFISSPDSGRIARSQEGALTANAAESATWMTLTGKAEDIGLCSPPLPTIAEGFSNEMAVQFDHPAAEIAILTNTGIHVIRRRRLVDVFAAIARVGGGGEDSFATEIKNFIRSYGRGETLAAALAVACGQGMEISTDQRMTRIRDPEVLELARRVFIDYGGRPSPNENSVADTSTVVEAWNPSPRHTGIALYISRLVRSIWKKQIAKTDKADNGALTVTASVDTAKLQVIQHDLSSLKDFLDANKSFIEGLSGPEALARAANRQEEAALQAEHRALHSLVKLLSHTIQGISFVLVLFDERVDEIVASLPVESKDRFLKLTFEELFSAKIGEDIAKELVKSIVNRNIAKGSNVETVADALRRRCGNFCSPGDVVIFKAQELLNRATAAGVNSELGRNLLNESLNLFQQVADQLPMDYLVTAVNNYIANQFFAGAIQLVLTVATSSDKTDRALSWIQDSRPEQVHLPPRLRLYLSPTQALTTHQDSRQDFYEYRKRCYDLIAQVIVAVDDLATTDPGLIDGMPTVIARRKNEAYSVISSSKDEVFLTTLYDWYLDQGWSDRLLQIQSPFVITYLERKSMDDITHADLLWRYYAQSERFFEAAKVQLKLAQSAFVLPLSRRIEYLGRARANASIFTPDVGRQSRQRLLQEISELIDVANVQDDLLQRLRDDDRIAADRREAVLRDVDNQVHDLSTIYNQYTGPASYYDLCLQIFYLANHTNTADINDTWRRLIDDIHDTTTALPDAPWPYEAVIEKIRSLGSRLRLSEVVFPIQTLIPLLEEYSLERQRGVALNHWIIDLFLDLGVAHQSIYSVLEAMYYTDAVPFSGANRRFLANDMIYLLEVWFHESARIGGLLFGSSQVAERVSESLLLLQQGGQNTSDVRERSADLRRRIVELLE
ncbi:hypothetical protein N7512_005121 [Penicillium capsulatum]|nr:hypothetical protein N7512_005121 [Penicillium capsulatum]